MNSLDVSYNHPFGFRKGLCWAMGLIYKNVVRPWNTPFFIAPSHPAPSPHSTIVHLHPQIRWAIWWSLLIDKKKYLKVPHEEKGAVSHDDALPYSLLFDSSYIPSPVLVVRKCYAFNEKALWVYPFPSINIWHLFVAILFTIF